MRSAQRCKVDERYLFRWLGNYRISLAYLNILNISSFTTVFYWLFDTIQSTDKKLTHMTWQFTSLARRCQMEKKTRLRFSWTLSVEVKPLWIAFVFLIVSYRNATRRKGKKRDLWKRWWTHSWSWHSFYTKSLNHIIMWKVVYTWLRESFAHTEHRGKQFDVWPLSAGCAASWLRLAGKGKLLEKGPRSPVGAFHYEWVSLEIVPWWISEMMKCQIVDSLCACREFAIHNQSVTANDDSNKTIINYFLFSLLSGTYTLHKAK